MSYESIMAGVDVQEKKALLQKAKDQYLNTLAVITGAEATGRGFLAPEFTKFQPAVDAVNHAHELTVQLVCDRIIAEAEARGEA